MIKLSSAYKKNPEIIFREIAGEAVLVPMKRNTADLEKIFTLNEVATRIWNVLDTHTSVAQIQEKIVEEFEVASDEVRRDIDDFLKLLLENNIIQKS
jgi:Coenzyme PQQ synthesis protein D (PqqD)